MNWFYWALLSAFFAGLTAICAKIGVAEVNSNLATAIRTSFIVVFTWGIAFFNGGIQYTGKGVSLANAVVPGRNPVTLFALYLNRIYELYTALKPGSR